MNEGNWVQAIKSLEIALKLHRMQPDYNLALGRCYMELGNIDEAITYLGTVVRIRPKNTAGWIELLKCLYKGKLFDEGLEYSAFAFEQTDSKPIFIYFQSMFLFALGKHQDALISLENGLKASPKLIKQFIEINPSILQRPLVAELISLYKNKKKK